jgi:long-chain fatty acid transport protein
MKLFSRLGFLAVFASSAVAQAAGFQLGEESASATGMAGAFTAKADDASAIFYNPAGIAKLRGPQVYLGGMVIVGESDAHSTPAFAIPGGSQDSHLQAVFVPNFYLSWGLPHGFAVGIGAFTNFGLKVTWFSNWAGRFVSTWANLEDVTFNPTVAWQPVRWFSIGAGLDVTPARVELARAENVIDAEARLKFKANGVGVGGNVAVLFEVPRANHPSPFQVGVSYRSQYNLKFDDGVLRANSVPIELTPILHDTSATVEVPIPDTVSLGVGGRPVDRLFVQFQFDWTNWERLQSLQLNASNKMLSQTIVTNWRDGYTLRIGGEYNFGPVAARLGFGFDWTPVPQSTLGPIVPDSFRYLVAGGAKVNLPRGFALEAAIMGVIFKDRQSNLPELPIEYRTWAVLTSFAVSYHHPARKKEEVPPAAPAAPPPATTTTTPPANAPTLVPSPTNTTPAPPHTPILVPTPPKVNPPTEVPGANTKPSSTPKSASR